MADRLYKRAARLTVYRPVAGSFSRTQAQAIEISDLRISFLIEKTLGSDPNTATIHVFNAAENTRAELQRKPLHVRLDAGYENNLSRIFTGDLQWGSAKLDGVTWDSEIQAGDGARGHRFARVSHSFKSKVDVKRALKLTAKTMGLKLPRNVEQAKDLVSQFASGVTLQGSSHKEMTRLLRGTGYGWSVQDGKLQILKGGDLRPDQAALINVDNGLIGTPTMGPPKEAGGKPVLSLRCLLYPRLSPGTKTKVESNAVDGVFKIQSVRHAGDLEGADWTTSIEATPV